MTDAEQRARELLAEELERHPNSYKSYAKMVRKNEHSNTTLEAAVSAILRALPLPTPQPAPDGGVTLVKAFLAHSRHVSPHDPISPRLANELADIALRHASPPQEPYSEERLKDIIWQCNNGAPIVERLGADGKTIVFVQVAVAMEAMRRVQQPERDKS